MKLQFNLQLSKKSETSLLEQKLLNFWKLILYKYAWFKIDKIYVLEQKLLTFWKFIVYIYVWFRMKCVHFLMLFFLNFNFEISKKKSLFDENKFCILRGSASFFWIKSFCFGWKTGWCSIVAIVRKPHAKKHFFNDHQLKAHWNNARNRN